MATTNREKHYSVGKEKRGTSPSNSLTSHSQRSGRQPTTDKEKATERNIPNYLRPTISSRHEPSKAPLKKNNSNEDQQKFLRRRSFDRPPSASPTVHKALLSPGRSRERTAVPGLPREKNVKVRSTSVPAKTTSQKPVVDSRTSKTPKATKPQTIPSRRINKSTNTSVVNKKECNASPSTMASNSNKDVTHVMVEDDTKQEEKEPLVHEVEEIIKVENEEEDLHSEIQKPEKEELVDGADRDTEVNYSSEDDKIKPFDISTVSEDENLLPQFPAQNEETEDKSKEVDIVTVQEAKENVSKSDESGDNHPEETAIEEAKAEEEEKSGEDQNATEELASNEDTRDEKDVERNEQVGEEESLGIDKGIKEGQEVDGDGDQKANLEDEAAAAAAANVMSKRQDQGQGKKESPTAYNDVIEETASRLLQKRKNKVRALVGAFETVIDYESSSTPK